MRSSARLLCGAAARHILTSSPRSVARNHDPIVGERHARAREEQKLSERMSLRRFGSQGAGRRQGNIWVDFSSRASRADAVGFRAVARRAAACWSAPSAAAAEP